MTEEKSKLTRRKFMLAGSAAIASPLMMKMVGAAGEAKAAEAKTAEKKYEFVDQKSCDLVVLGGGGSGLVAAVRAAQVSGKKVIVLEKDTTAGGGAQGAKTIRTFGSKWQEKRGIPDTTSAWAKEMMEWMYWRLDEKVVDSALRGTGRFFDWLCEEGGDIEGRFKEGKYVFALSENDPVGPQMSGFGKFVVDMMKEKCEKYGVEVLTGHPVKDIEVKDGKVVAAIAKSDSGYVRVACKACVLATGSWIRNEEIVKKYVPDYYQATQGQGQAGGQGGPGGGQGGAPPQGGQGGAPQGGQMGGPGGQGGPEGGQGGPPQGGGGGNVGHTSPNYTGDGIALAEKIGAFVDYDSFCVRPMGPLPGMGASGTFAAMTQSPFIITVNRNGERYCAEPVVMNLGFFNGGSVLMKQPGAQSYDVFDQNAIKAAFEYQNLPEDQKIPKNKVELTPGFEVSLPETWAEIKKEIAGANSSVTQADTLEELADKLGVDKKKFLETVKAYNEGCKTGVDQFFKNQKHLAPIKKGPFYAFKGGFGTDGAFGGVRINHEMQAYKADRENLVEGLYVTGDFASGRHLNMNGVKWQVLNDLSWAFSSGFTAGTNVGEYLKKKA